MNCLFIFWPSCYYQPQERNLGLEAGGALGACKVVWLYFYDSCKNFSKQGGVAPLTPYLWPWPAVLRLFFYWINVYLFQQVKIFAHWKEKGTLPNFSVTNSKPLKEFRKNPWPLNMIIFLQRVFFGGFLVSKGFIPNLKRFRIRCKIRNLFHVQYIARHLLFAAKPF